jgi:DNA/RNA-binding domain of Phe-tRNA-synthetase-like protein
MTALSITATSEWGRLHAGALIGILEISGADNAHPSPTLEGQKRLAEQKLRQFYANFTRKELLELPVMAAYQRYYNQFEKTYHVLLQLESIVLKGKNLPNVSPLVDACFLAEVETLILTASHDADRLKPPLMIDVTRNGDQFTRMGGEPKILPPGDMAMRDQTGVVCTILYGQDNSSPVSKSTNHVVYVSYVPAGIESTQVKHHLAMIQDYVKVFAPESTVEKSVVLTTQ